MEDVNIRPYKVPENSPVSLLTEDEMPGSLSPLEDENSQPIDLSALQGKLVGFYFSAGWCPPCRSFSPVLAHFAAQHPRDFQVVFVSSDHSEQAMKEYIAGKGWLRVRWDSSVRGQLFQYLGVSMLPTLVICNADTGHVVTHWGRFALITNERNCLQNWQRGSNGISIMSMLGLGSIPGFDLCMQ